MEIVDGRFINERDIEDARSVAIIDENGAKAIFGTNDAVGKSMQLTAASSSKKVTIIGVSKSSVCSEEALVSRQSYIHL